MTLQTEPSSAIESPGSPFHRASRKVVASLGLLAAGGGFLLTLALPIAGIGMRAEREEVQAAAAHEDMIGAALAITGSTIIDNSSDEVVLLQRFTDNDTLAVRTGSPNPERARSLIEKASSELQGTSQNANAAEKLSRLADDQTLTAGEVIGAVGLIDTRVANGDVITGNDLLIEAGVVGIGALGFLVWASAGPIRTPRPE